MKEFIVPLENHNLFKFDVTTCPEGVKHFFDTNNYLFFKNLFSLDDKFTFVEKKVSEAIMNDAYCSFKGDLRLICSTTQSLKVKLGSGYFLLNSGDAFLYDTHKVKIDLKKAGGGIFSPLIYTEIFLSNMEIDTL